MRHPGYVLAASFALMCVGCSTSHKLVTARHTPCRAREVRIVDKQRGARVERWTAHCGARAYECEARTLDDRHIAYRCRPAAPSTEEP